MQIARLESRCTNLYHVHFDIYLFIIFLPLLFLNPLWPFFIGSCYCSFPGNIESVHLICLVMQILITNEIMSLLKATMAHLRLHRMCLSLPFLPQFCLLIKYKSFHVIRFRDRVMYSVTVKGSKC